MVLYQLMKYNRNSNKKMEDKEKVKNTKVQEIFLNMEYGESLESTTKAIEWIKIKESSFFAFVDKSSESPNGIPTELKNCVNNEVLCSIYVPEIDIIKNILSKSKKSNKWADTSALARTKLLNKLASEIEKNADELSQVEIVSRGILAGDTKTKAVALLAQYFYYFSSFAVNYNQENPNWKPEGIAVGLVSNENSLANLGLILAPALAAGYNVILQVGTKITPATTFIVDLATNAGIPQGTIRLIPSDDGELLPYLSNENVLILSLFVDLLDEKYRGINSFNKKILNLSSYKTPYLVFDSADLDSACENIIDSAWGYQSLLPWSVNSILVQENIFETFLTKLKNKLYATKIGTGNNKQVDISYPSDDSYSKLTQMLKLAKSQGIEVFQTEESSNTFTPTLFIGGKVQTNKVLRADDGERANVVTVLAFRSIDEAVNLANNTRQGLAASVWSENIGVVNEVTRKLKVSNVWVNSFGLTSADVTLSPIKDSGVGYFGGREGFYEYVQIKNSGDTNNSNVPQKLNTSVASTISAAKKAQESWSRVSKLNKSKHFHQFAEFIADNKKNFSTTLMEKWLENWVANIYECVTDTTKQSHCTTHYGYSLTSMREPRGIVAIETKREVESHNVKLILRAIFEGNSVVLLNDTDIAHSFYKEFSQKLPSGVLNVIPYDLCAVKTAAMHKELNAYFGEGGNSVFGSLPLRDSKIFTNVSSNLYDICRKVTVSKNIWSSIGKSSTYNLSNY